LENRQDEWIMATQQPNRPDLAIEHLVAADAATATFVNLRHRLIREAESQREGDTPPVGQSEKGRLLRAP